MSRTAQREDGTVVELDPQTLKKTLRALKAEEAATKARLVTIEQARSAIELLLPEQTNTGTHTKHTKTSSNGSGPRGIEAVERVLLDAGRPLSVKEIVAEITAKGWIRPDAKTPVEATRLALRRLSARKPQYVRLHNGNWAYAPAQRGAT